MRKHITAFYLETLLLIVVFVGIILVLTGIFGQARAESAQARHLTEAVNLAENAAEAVAAAEDADTLGTLLGEIGRVQRNDDVLVVYCGDYMIHVTWEPDLAWVPSGELITSTITVLWVNSRNDPQDVIYSLETARYVGGTTG